MLSGRASTPCPSDDTLGALVHHALDPAAVAAVTSHLDECAACQRLVIAAVQGGVPPPRAGSVTESSSPTPEVGGATAGTRLGRYELRALLGIGGMGSVYEAHDTELDRAVAIKLLRRDLDEVPGLAARLVHESRLMARVNHPSVITVYDAGRVDDALFIAMEIVRGSTLSAYLLDHELDWRAIVALFERAGHGLAAAHAAGIIHRDFKPDNVLVGGAGADKVVVTDFGIAREAAAPAAPEAAAADLTAPITSSQAITVRDRMTARGGVMGTPAYMAPELFAGSKADVASDVFAFSVSLWEAVFRARPFPGRDFTALLTAMRSSPVPPPGRGVRVPRRLVRALHKGLAIDPRDRWPDMPALLAELARIRAHRRRLGLAASAAGLVGLGLTAALAVTRPAPAAPAVDRCARALGELDRAYNPILEGQVLAALAGAPQIQATVLSKLRATAEAWRATERATCRADRDVIQDATITACLEARRIELAGSVDDLIADGPAHAIRISDVPSSPSACTSPAPGLLFARVPADRELRRKVTALRGRIADARDALAREDFARALAEAQAVVDASTALWSPLHAEALLALGTIQRTGSGELARGIATLLDAATTAELAHHDAVAVDSWIQLVQAALFDKGDPAHALEYAARAEAAVARVGRPALASLMLAWAKGLALASANRSDEAERALREAVALAEPLGARAQAFVLEALGSFYTHQGRPREAVAMHQQAIEHMEAEHRLQPAGLDELADSLALSGDVVRAEAVARRAVELADRTLPETQFQRPAAHRFLAKILLDAGRDREALAEAVLAADMVGRSQGTRSERYGEMLRIHGEILVHLGRHAQAEPMLARACEVLAFTLGDDNDELAICEVSHGAALVGLHRGAAALDRLDRAVPALIKQYGDSHWAVADAVRTRGTAHAALGHHRAAIADLERAIAILTSPELSAQIEPGHLAAARWQLGRELWTTQPARARAEVAAALDLFANANGKWAGQRAEAAAWLAGHGRR